MSLRFLISASGLLIQPLVGVHVTLEDDKSSIELADFNADNGQSMCVYAVILNGYGLYRAVILACVCL